MNIVDELHAIATALRTAGVPYAVCGGIVGNDHLVLDLLLEEAAYAGTLQDRVDVDLPAGTVTFVSRDTLVKMKQLAGRPIDLADLEKLEEPDAT